jgi:N-acyl-D-amino-acid deacylase
LLGRAERSSPKDALERRERAIDIAAQAAHLPMRVYVMRDRAIRRATADDIAEMRNLTIEALRVGAFGVTTSRTDSHKTLDGELVPSRNADPLELLGIGSALGAACTGAFGMHSDFDDEDYELRWMRKLARDTGRPVWFLLTDRYEDPERWRRLMKAVHAARSEGLSLTAQIAGRPIGVMMGIGTALNPFTVRPSYKALEALSIAEQRKRLRNPDLRRKILAEKPSEAEVAKLAQFRQLITKRWDKFFTMGDPPDYEPDKEMSVAAIAMRTARTPDEVAYDYIIEEKLYFPVVNYVAGDHEPIREMLSDPACLLGLSDGGSHCTSIVDSGLPSFMLAHWGRDRHRGPRLPIEHLVKRQTSETADFFWPIGSWSANAWLAYRCERHRLRPSTAAQAGASPRYARLRPALRPTCRGIRSNDRSRHSHLRARRAYRCDAGASRTGRPQWSRCVKPDADAENLWIAGDEAIR